MPLLTNHIHFCFTNVYAVPDKPTWAFDNSICNFWPIDLHFILNLKNAHAGFWKIYMQLLRNHHTFFEKFKWSFWLISMILLKKTCSFWQIQPMFLRNIHTAFEKFICSILQTNMQTLNNPFAVFDKPTGRLGQTHIKSRSR